MKRAEQHNSVSAIILAGGKGTRLKSVLPDRQKCVAEIDGTPFLHLLIQHLTRFGFHHVIICTGHRAASVREALNRAALDKRRPCITQNVEIEISHEKKPLGTGGAIRQALALARSDTVLALNGDSICPVNLCRLLKFHRKKRSDLTVVLSHADGRRDGGNVRIARNSRILGFGEKDGAATPHINAGIYCFNRSIFGVFARGRLSMETHVIPGLLRKRVFGFVTSAPLLDIGTPGRYRKAAAVIQSWSRGRRLE